MFSDAEKANIVRLVNGVAGNLHTALGTELATAIRDQQDPVGMLKAGTAAVSTASREVSLTLNLLMGQNGQAGFNDPKPPTRDAALQAAWFHLDRVFMFIDTALAYFANATGPNTVRARTIWLPQARAAAALVDRSLAYLDPTPQPPSPDGFVKIVGPHGDFDHAEWSIWRSWWYCLDALDEVIPRYDEPGCDAFNFVAKAAGISGICAHGIARFGDIDTTQQELDNRAKLATLPAGPFGVQFWLILAYSQVLTDFNIPSGVSGPGFYQQLQDALAPAGPAFATARAKTTDSWRRMDSASWHGFLAFPGCDLNADPAGCAAKLPSQQPPPTPTPTPVVGKLTVSLSSIKQGAHTVTAVVNGAAQYTLRVDEALVGSNPNGIFSWVAVPGTRAIRVTAATATGSVLADLSTSLTVTKK